MEKSSYFIESRAMFGSFPTQESVNSLEEEGVRFFVNLTNDYEKKITPYTTKYNYISYPIKDRHTPTDKNSFAVFIIKLTNIISELKNGELMYLHCKGGHGRSGVVVAVLLCYIFKIKPQESLEYTTIYHNRRKIMREKWRKIGSPQTYEQKKFVYNFCKTITFYKACKIGITAGFSNFTNHPIIINNLGIFPTSESAFQAHKCLENNEYVEKQKNSISPIYSKKLGNKVKKSDNWNNNKIKIMYKILKCKFDQYKELKENLLNTGISPIIYTNKNDNFWGCGEDFTGENNLGKQLVKLREFYHKM
jgi:ribA/ribD-fused uncharacterized protein